jgi:energy-coupling factor transporter ATP-binding protein EcfA2
MKYQTLTIENFRGISNLEITDLKGINLLVGRNNCGKTSVLEALFLLSGMANPQLPLSIHNFRDLILTNDEDFSFMFKNLDFAAPVRLKGRVDSNDRKLTVTPFYGFYQPQNDGKPALSQPESLSAASNLRMVEGINLDFETHKNEKYHGEFHIKEAKVMMPGNYKEILACSYLSSRIANAAIDKQIANLLINKKLDSIISVLRGIEPAVLDIRLGPNSMVYIDIGAERLIPINVMGDGMRKILTFLATIATTKNGVLLIDEIENGLHYSSLSVVWKALFAACKEYNVQIIATTHSYECVEAFSKSYDAFDPEGDDIRLFRIDKEGEKHTAFSSNAKVLRAGIEKEFEVR